MVSTTDLQALVEKIDGGTKGVDLVKIGQDSGECGQGRGRDVQKVILKNLINAKVSSPKSTCDMCKINNILPIVSAHPRSLRHLRVALDIEGCLDRFYGGYYSGELS